MGTEPARGPVGRRCGALGLATAVAVLATAVVASADLTKMDLEVQQIHGLSAFKGQIFANKDCRKERQVRLWFEGADGPEKAEPLNLNVDATDKHGEFSMPGASRRPGEYFARVSKASKDGETCAKGESDPVQVTG
jgi:hypothetical protein